MKKILNLIDNPAESVIDSGIILESNFKDIPKTNPESIVNYVDGGICELLVSPSWGLYFNRVYIVTYSGNNRVKNKLAEFYSLIYTQISDSELKYHCTYFDVKGKIDLADYTFDPFDHRLTTSNNRASIFTIANVIRRLAELKVVNDIPKHTTVLDGSLEQKHQFETDIVSSWQDRRVLGFSKTNDCLTAQGDTINAVLSKRANKKTWYYYAGQKNDLRTYFVKLHPKSRYVFKIDTYQELDEHILSVLSNNAKDVSFIGYPYGLIEADRFARVTKKETQLLKMQIITKLGIDYNKIEPYINSINAHSILDSIG